MRNTLACLGALVLLAATAGAEPYWIAWEGNDLPENEGWTRSWGNWQGHHQGGAIRTLENGILTYDSLYDPGAYDFSYMQRPGQIDPDPEHLFIMEWRLKVEEVVGFADPTVALFSDGAWALGFAFTESAVYSTFENYLTIPIVPGLFHEYRVVSPDMRTYTLFIDGLPARNGFFKHVFSTSEVGWGDGIQGAASVHHWDYFRFGVIAEPSSMMGLFPLVARVLWRRPLRNG